MQDTTPATQPGVLSVLVGVDRQRSSLRRLGQVGQRPTTAVLQRLAGFEFGHVIAHLCDLIIISDLTRRSAIPSPPPSFHRIFCRKVHGEQSASAMRTTRTTAVFAIWESPSSTLLDRRWSFTSPSNPSRLTDCSTLFAVPLLGDTSLGTLV